MSDIFTAIGKKDVLDITLLLPSQHHKRGMYGSTVLYALFENDLNPLIKLAVQSGADINAKDMYGYSLLHLVVTSTYTEIKFLKDLLRCGADINALNYRGENILHVLMKDPCIDLEHVKKIINFGLDFGLCIDALSDNSKTILIYAAEKQNTPLVEYLIYKGANTELRDSWGMSYLDYLNI